MFRQTREFFHRLGVSTGKSLDAHLSQILGGGSNWTTRLRGTEQTVIRNPFMDLKLYLCRCFRQVTLNRKSTLVLDVLLFFCPLGRR